MSDLYQKLTIDTPENILLDAQIAGFGSRCVAALIDYAIIAVFMLVALLLFRGAIGPASGLRGTSGDALIAIYVLVQFAIISFYHLLFELIWNGQTPGKRRVGIRVVGANGLPVTAAGVIIRNLVRLFDFLPIFYAVGLVVMFGSKSTQRLGDLAARTVVIYDRKGLALETLREDLSVNYIYLRRTDLIPPYVQIAPLTAQDRRTVVDFLQRRSNLTNRAQMAALLSRTLYRKMRNHAPEAMPMESDLLRNADQAEQFLEHTARAFEVFGQDEDEAGLD